MRYQLEVVQRRAGNRLGLSLKTTDGILTTECPADHNRWIILSEILCVCVCVCMWSYCKVTMVQGEKEKALAVQKIVII